MILSSNFYNTDLMRGKKPKQKINTHSNEEKQSGMSSFTINYRYENDPQYPYLLACNLNKSQEQFEQTRSMKMLGEWVEEYVKLSQILKYKYTPYIPKIQNILLQKYLQKMNFDYCLSRFIMYFYQTWEQITQAIKKDLFASDKYALDFLWYTCHSLVEDMNLNKINDFLEYLNISFQDPLRHFEPDHAVEARKIIQIVYLMNIHGCQPPFEKQAVNWSVRFKSFVDAATSESKNTLMVAVIKNKNLLQAKQSSFSYWQELVKFYLGQLQQRIPKMSINNPSDRHLLDLFIWLLDLKQVKDLLLESIPRYLKSFLSNMRIRQDQPDYIFAGKKYKDIMNILYKLFFQSNIQETKKRLGAMIQKFTGHSYFVLNEAENYTFLDCLTQRPIKLENNTINDIIRVLSNNHVRRTLPAKVLMVLAQTITASLDSCQLSDQLVGQCLKAFNDSMFHKTKDPLIGQLRYNISKLFLGIMQRYSWEDGYKNQAIYNLCQQSLRNSLFVSETVFQILYLLVKKFGFSNETKIEPMIIDVFYKTLASEEQLHSLISLLVTVALNIKFPKATSLIEEVCSKNPSKHASFYHFQALCLARDVFPHQQDFKTVHQMLQSQNHWEDNRIDINLMMLEVFFLKSNLSDSIRRTRKIDKNLKQMLIGLYKQGKYRLLALIAAKIFPALGGDPDTLESFESYNWFRQFSFDMLARSFYKSTSINVCYVYSYIILRSQNPGNTIKWLAKEQFLDYLYQGLNDFISKEKQFTLELITTITLFKLIRNEPHLVPQSSRLLQFSTLVKNVSWWDEAGNNIHFCPFNEGLTTSWALPQFKTFYIETVQTFFEGYFIRHAQKLRKEEELQHKAFQEEI